MSALTGSSPGGTFKALLHVSNFSTGVDGTLRAVSDGEGTASALELSTTEAKVNGQLTVTGGITDGTNAYVQSNDTRLAQATESARGTAEVATQAETNAGADDAKIVTPLKLAQYLAGIGQRIYVPFTFLGELIDEQIFGYLVAPFSGRAIGVDWALQEACTGSAGTLDIVDSDGNEQGKVVTLTASAKKGQTIFGTALTLTAGAGYQLKVKSIGLTTPGTGLTANLIITP